MCKGKEGLYITIILGVSYFFLICYIDLMLNESINIYMCIFFALIITMFSYFFIVQFIRKKSETIAENMYEKQNSEIIKYICDSDDEDFLRKIKEVLGNKGIL